MLILCSFGMPSVVEPVARFTTAWLIAGFTDAIADDGSPPTGIDARFYWPAFFAQWAFFRDAGGAAQLDTVLRWFPPVVVAVWAIGIYALARSMLGGTRAPWVAAWLFVGLNWIEQDYFSPAGHRHRAAADGADVRARPAGHPPHRLGGCARLALPAPRRANGCRCCAAGWCRR